MANRNWLQPGWSKGLGLFLLMVGAVVGLVLLLFGCSNPSEPRPVERSLSITMLGDRQEGVVGSELSLPVVARVEAVDKALGAAPEPVAGLLVSWVVVSGGGSTFVGSGMTNGLGEARNRWTLGSVAGTQVLEARAVDADTGEPIVFQRIEATATPGPVTWVSVLGPIDQALDGDMLDLASMITGARDQYGNTTSDLSSLTFAFRTTPPCDCAKDEALYHTTIFTLDKALLGAMPFDGYLVVYADGGFLYDNIRLIVNPRPTL